MRKPPPPSEFTGPYDNLSNCDGFVRRSVAPQCTCGASPHARSPEHSAERHLTTTLAHSLHTEHISRAECERRPRLVAQFPSSMTSSIASAIAVGFSRHIHPTYLPPSSASLHPRNIRCHLPHRPAAPSIRSTALGVPSRHELNTDTSTACSKLDHHPRHAPMSRTRPSNPSDANQPPAPRPHPPPAREQ